MQHGSCFPLHKRASRPALIFVPLPSACLLHTAKGGAQRGAGQSAGGAPAAPAVASRCAFGQSVQLSSSLLIRQPAALSAQTESLVAPPLPRVPPAAAAKCLPLPSFDIPPPPPPPNNLLGGPEHGGVFAAAAPPEHRFGLHASSKGFLAPGTGARRGHVARAMLKSGWEARAPLCALLHALYYVHVRLGCAALRSVDPAAPPPAPPPGASSGTAAELQRHSGGQQRELHTLRLHRQFRPLSIDCLQTPFSVSRATASSTTVLPVARRRSRHARRSAGETASCDAARWP